MASIDEARLLRGGDIVINDFITVRQPTLNEIVDYGEQRFFSIFYSFCAIPSDMKSMLYDAGLDFMQLSDWQLFIMLTHSMTIEDTSIIIPNIEFSKMELMQVNDTGEVVLSDGNIVITESVYLQFIDYVRNQIGYILKREKAANNLTKQVLIEQDRMNRSASLKKDYSSILNPIVISLVNTEEFGYTYQTVYDITLYQLFKSFYQIQKKKSACALYQGSMSGFVDTSKINKSEFSWIYEITKKT